MYNFAIIDDNNQDYQNIASLIIEHCDYNNYKCNIDYYQNPLHFSFDNHYDAIFLDIEMPQLNGLLLAEKLNKINPTVIIFITNHNNFLHLSLNVRPFHFINKDSLKIEGINVLNLLFKRLENNKLILNTKEGKKRLLISDINYISIKDGITIINTYNENINTKHSLKEIHDKLKLHHFTKVNQSTLVNMVHVKEIINTKVILDNEIEFILSSRAKTNFIRSFKEYFLESI